MPKSAKRKRAPDDKTRRRIMAYAGRVFMERGFRKVSVEELCAGMAISKRTFYGYFADRDELVTAVVLELLAPLREAIIENLESNRPVEEIFRTHFDLLINQLFQRVSLQFMTDVQNLMPDLWNTIENFRRQIVVHITALLRRGQNEGSVRADIDPEVIGRVFQGFLQSFANPNLVASLGLSMQQVATTFQKIATGGILAPPAREHGHEKTKKIRR
jgi:AcrR family transcriptional regulator